MANFEDITGKRFGKMVVIQRIGNKDNRPYFLCKCDCGKTKECSSQNLKKGSIQSCGCLKRELKFKDLTGKVFSRLTVLKENGTLGEGKAKKSAFLCECICGNKKTVRGGDLVSGKIVSCGCWRDEKVLENISGVDTTLEDPIKTNSIKIYKRNYNDGNLTFDQFINLTSEFCYYCGIGPSNNYNTFKTTKNSAQSSIENGNFNYNGLDRVNSSLPHDFENCVPCCKNCNIAKSNMTVDEFKQFIINSYNHSILEINDIGNVNKYFDLINKICIDRNDYNRKQHPAISSARVMFKNYNDGNLKFEQFVKITQHNCVYCNSEPQNKFNAFTIRDDSSQYAKDNGDFVYNGLDRVDPNLPHNIENCVPCCFKCNWSKSNNTLAEYKEWVVRVYNYLIK